MLLNIIFFCLNCQGGDFSGVKREKKIILIEDFHLKASCMLLQLLLIENWTTKSPLRFLRILLSVLLGFEMRMTFFKNVKSV